MTPGAQKAVIHIVDDDKVVVDSLTLLLTFLGYKAIPWTSASEFLEVAPLKQGEMLIMDLQMPDINGFEALGQLRVRGCLNPALLMTGNGDSAVEQDARSAGFLGVLHKPFSEQDLLGAIDAAQNMER